MADLYQPFFCEENVFQLLAGDRLGDRAARAEVVFISNPAHQVACWEQRAAGARGEPIVWDYHVVAAVPYEAINGEPINPEPGPRWEVWDLDTYLPCPAPAASWLAATFLDPAMIRPRFWPRFRIVPRTRFLGEFATDRSHMRRPDGRWRRPPPPWPPPGAPAMNLPAWTDMTPGVGPGVVMDRAALAAYWGLSAPVSGLTGR